MKKLQLFLIILLIITTPIFASFETWLGTGFISHTTVLDNSEKVYFKDTYLSDIEQLNSIIFIGPTINLDFIPYNKIPIGVKLSSEFLFPVGYNKGSGFRSYNYDYKNRSMFSITFNKTFSNNFGGFAEIGYEFDSYRIATTNHYNSKEHLTYNRFNNHAIYGEIGLLTTMEHGYFKFGFDYSKSIMNNASSYDLIFTGGYRF